MTIHFRPGFGGNLDVSGGRDEPVGMERAYEPAQPTTVVRFPMSKTAIVSLLFCVLVAGLIWVGMQGVDGAQCEVCITYNGETLCRTGQGRDKESAIRKAQEAACALLAGDRADNMKCTSTTPDRVECK